MRKSEAWCAAVVIGVWQAVGGVSTAEALTLEPPVACGIGKDGCVVQNYVDVDPSPDRLDFACGALTYNGHNGTDFRIANLAVMKRGVAVLAAADGTVARLRDGAADRGQAEMTPGQEAGNAVVLSHGDGWETQYSHLKQGSITVQTGQTVKAGAPLAEIGLSGNTVFPHVDLTVRHHGVVIDPFRGENAAAGCRGERRPLWSRQAQALLTYPGAGVIQAGFAGGDVDADAARRGDYEETTLTAAATKLAFWAESFGLRPGDRLSMQLLGPRGQVLQTAQGGVDRNMASAVMSVIASTPPGGWPPGSYRGRFKVERDNRILVDVTRTLNP